MSKRNDNETAALAADPVRAQRVAPMFRERLAFVGQQCNDYTLMAPENMTVEDLTDPAVWALVKQAPGQPTLGIGDSIRIIHRAWFAECVVDVAGRGEPCRVLVRSVVARKSYGEIKRDLIPEDHEVVQDPKTGHQHAIFYRGRERERVVLAEYSTWQDAADACRDHANRTARQ